MNSTRSVDSPVRKPPKIKSMRSSYKARWCCRTWRPISHYRSNIEKIWGCNAMIRNVIIPSLPAFLYNLRYDGESWKNKQDWIGWTNLKPLRWHKWKLLLDEWYIDCKMRPNLYHCGVSQRSSGVTPLNPTQLVQPISPINGPGLQGVNVWSIVEEDRLLKIPNHSHLRLHWKWEEIGRTRTLTKIHFNTSCALLPEVPHTYQKPRI